MRLVFLVLITAVFAHAVQSEIPYMGLKAEMEKRWNDAANVYEDAVWNDPNRVDLYLRLADIYAVEKEYEKASDTLLRAIEVEPTRAVLFVKLSEVYAVDNKPEKAFSAINSAVQLEPDNTEYLLAQAKIANWTKRPKVAVASLERILKQDPENREVRLLLAKSQEWAKELDDAIDGYQRYLEENPDDLEVRLKLAELQYIVNDVKGANLTLTAGFENIFSGEPAISLKQHNASAQEIPVLMYHCIGKTSPNSYWVTEEEFAAQMRYLKDQGYEAITSSALNVGTVLPLKPVMITFDDGCQNLYTQAYPVLKENGFAAEVFLISGAIAETEAARKENSAARAGGSGEASDAKYLIWPEVKEMAADGIVFGAHSKPYGSMDDDEMAYELMYSKLAIFKHIGIRADSFAYTSVNADTGSRLQTMLQKYGYDTAFASEGGLVPLHDIEMLDIPRIEIYGAHPKNDYQSRGVSVVPDPSRPADLFSAKLSPSDAERFCNASNRYAAAGDADKALVMINRSVSLEPENIRYLNTRLHAAAAAQNVGDVVDSAERIYRLDPENTDNILQLARSMVWENDLNGAAHYYAYYYNRHPEDQEVYIEYAQVEMWRGNYAASLSVLDKYEEKFGSDDIHKVTKANALAWANRPSRSFDLLEPIFQKNRADYQANYINTVALQRHREPAAAVESLEKVEMIAPDANENRFLSDYIRTPLRPSVTAGLEYRIDSDKVSILSALLRGQYHLSPATALYAGWRTDYLRVSGEYNPEPFGTQATHNALRVGISHRFSPLLKAGAYIGAANAEGENDGVYGADVTLSALDQLSFLLSYDHRYFVITPKTVALGLKDDALNAGVHWEETLLWYADASVGYDVISDDNKRWNINLSQKRMMVRSQYWNIDAGVTANIYGYDNEALGYDGGYYAPESYQGYYLTGSVNRVLNSNDSVNLLVNGGFFKDNNMNAFELGGSFYLEGVFGVYQDWMFRASTGVSYSGRYYDESYRSASLQMYLTKRF